MKKNHCTKRIAACACALLVLLAAPAAAFATHLAVTAGETAVTAGDTVTVTVTVTADSLAVVDGVFTYDPALLSYISSDGGASDGYINMVSAQRGGASSLTAVIRFAAVGEGTAEVRVTLQNVLDYNGQALDGAEAGVSIAIAASGTVQPGESAAPVDISLTGLPAENVTGAAEPMYIWRSLTSLTLPSGFADRQVTYHGEYVGGAAVPDTEDLTLLYLSEKDGGNAGYYVYDAQKDTLFPYLTVQSVSKYYTLIWPDSGVTAPEGYVPAKFVWKEKEVPAWIAEGSDGSAYLVYARNSAGERGWYIYSVEDESVQTYIAPPASTPKPSEEPTPRPTDKPVSAPAESLSTWIKNPVCLVLGGACALLLAVSALFASLYLKASRGRRRAARMGKRMRKAPQGSEAGEGGPDKSGPDAP
jgi:hypothetical protein